LPVAVVSKLGPHEDLVDWDVSMFIIGFKFDEHSNGEDKFAVGLEEPLTSIMRLTSWVLNN